MAAQMWRAQADEAMEIAQRGAQHEQLLAGELEKARLELEQSQDVAREVKRLEARLEATVQAEARAVAARVAAEEQAEALRAAAKRSQREKDEAQERWSSQLNRARHTIESLQRRERLGSDTSLDITARYSP